MEVLNNNYLLKRVEEKKVKGGIVNTSKDTDDTTIECEVIAGLDKKLIGKKVVIAKYAGERYKEYHIVPETALLLKL